MGIVRVKAVHICQEDQQVRLEQGGYLGRKGVVVSHLDFFDGDGIIFIDNGNGPLAQ